MIIHSKSFLVSILGIMLFNSCNNAEQYLLPRNIEDIREIIILNSRGTPLRTKLAIGPYETSLGLSGVKPEQFQENQGLLFFFLQDEERLFWMPDTYFNLDIVFLNENLEILHLEKNVPAHPGRSENPPIPRTPIIKCRYVLETRANSPFSKGLTKGEKIISKSKYSMDSIKKFISKNY